MILQSARDQYRTQQRLTAEAVAASRRLWKRMSATDLDASWRSILPGVVAVTAASQLRAAQAGAEYLPKVRDELNLDEMIEGDVRPESLAGVSSYGTPLESALAGGVISTKTAIGKGAPVLQALQIGGNRLAGTIQTQVADAGRIAASVDAIGDKKITTYVRMLVPPSCSRCALLAGKHYDMDVAFQRHPKCDCRHVPCTEDVAGDLTTDPDEYFKSLSGPEQDRIFTKAGAQAIRDGARMDQVVNARRGMYTTKGGNLATRAGNTRRGMWGSSQTEFNKVSGSRYRTAKRHRMMPETIYGLTNDRAEQIRLLKYYKFMY